MATRRCEISLHVLKNISSESSEIFSNIMAFGIFDPIKPNHWFKMQMKCNWNTVRDLNSLPVKVVEAQSVKSFRAKLEMLWVCLFVIIYLFINYTF